MLSKNLFFAPQKIQNPTTANFLKKSQQAQILATTKLMWCAGSAMIEGKRDSGSSQKYKYKYKTDVMCKEEVQWLKERETRDRHK